MPLRGGTTKQTRSVQRAIDKFAMLSLAILSNLLINLSRQINNIKHLNLIKMQHFPFKKLFFATTFFILPFAILESILALLNIVPVDFNNTPKTGWTGFMISILFFPFEAVMFSVLNWIVLNSGYWFYSLFFKSERDKTRTDIVSKPN
jgi:hypothetical protein